MDPMANENLYMDTLLGEIPILEEEKPKQVSIYQENAEADDWYNKTITATTSSIDGLDSSNSLEPGYFLIKSLNYSFLNNLPSASSLFDLYVSIEGGDNILYLANYGAAAGTRINYDLTPIFKDVKITPGVKIIIRVVQLSFWAAYVPNTATLTMTGFRIRPFDVYKPSDTLK